MKKSSRMCWQFKEGGVCKFGDECRFSHDPNESSKAGARRAQTSEGEEEDSPPYPSDDDGAEGVVRKIAGKKGHYLCYTCGEDGHNSFQCTNEGPFYCEGCKSKTHNTKACQKSRDRGTNKARDKARAAKQVEHLKGNKAFVRDDGQDNNAKSRSFTHRKSSDYPSRWSDEGSDSDREYDERNGDKARRANQPRTTGSPSSNGSIFSAGETDDSTHRRSKTDDRHRSGSPPFRNRTFRFIKDCGNVSSEDESKGGGTASNPREPGAALVEPVLEDPELNLGEDQDASNDSDADCIMSDVMSDDLSVCTEIDSEDGSHDLGSRDLFDIAGSPTFFLRDKEGQLLFGGRIIDRLLDFKERRDGTRVLPENFDLEGYLTEMPPGTAEGGGCVFLGAATFSTTRKRSDVLHEEGIEGELFVQFHLPWTFWLQHRLSEDNFCRQPGTRPFQKGF
jgi:hypothetical protein